MKSSSKPSIGLRNARAEDAAQLVELGRSVNMTTFGRFVDEEVFRVHLEKTYSIPRVTADINEATKDFIVATVDGEEEGGEEKVIGFAVLARGNSYPFLEHLEGIIELQRIYIYPAFHGRGVGKALMAKLEDIARKEGKRNTWLGCYEYNEVARKVYERAGYEGVGKRSNKIGGELYWDIVMVKRL
jgi:ribosomal protein S18 acetylase RimI-like enzyme